MGHVEKLKAALVATSSDSHNPSIVPQPTNSVDRVLQRHLTARWADGTMQAELGLWEIEGDVVINELIELATAPPSKADPVLSKARTCKLYIIFVYALFCGFAHNLVLESMVSRKSNIERIHLNVGPEMLDFLFMYKCRQTAARALRCLASMRLRARPGDKVDKPLKHGANRSRTQQLKLIEQTESDASQIDTARLLLRGPGSIASALTLASSLAH